MNIFAKLLFDFISSNGVGLLEDLVTLHKSNAPLSRATVEELLSSYPLQHLDPDPLDDPTPGESDNDETDE